MMKNLLLLTTLLITLTGCSVMAIKKHNPHFKNVRALEAAKGLYKVDRVKGGSKELEEKLKGSSLSCRLTTFNMPANTTLDKFIDDALNDELDAAQKLSEKGTPITIVVNDLVSDTGGFSKGTWTLNFSYIVNSKTINVNTVTEFESAYSADTACRNTASALTDALTDNFAGLYKKLPR